MSTARRLSVGDARNVQRAFSRSDLVGACQIAPPIATPVLNVELTARNCARPCSRGEIARMGAVYIGSSRIHLEKNSSYLAAALGLAALLTLCALASEIVRCLEQHAATVDHSHHVLTQLFELAPAVLHMERLERDVRYAGLPCQGRPTWPPPRMLHAQSTSWNGWSRKIRRTERDSGTGFGISKRNAPLFRFP